MLYDFDANGILQSITVVWERPAVVGLDPGSNHCQRGTYRDVENG